MHLAELPVGKRRQYMQKDQREQLARCIELMQKDVEESPARVPYIGKPVKKRKCWRPKREK
jgi:hypothetical protein